MTYDPQHLGRLGDQDRRFAETPQRGEGSSVNPEPRPAERWRPPAPLDAEAVAANPQAPDPQAEVVGRQQMTANQARIAAAIERFRKGPQPEVVPAPAAPPLLSEIPGPDVLGLRLPEGPPPRPPSEEPGSAVLRWPARNATAELARAWLFAAAKMRAGGVPWRRIRALSRPRFFREKLLRGRMLAAWRSASEADVEAARARVRAGEGMRRQRARIAEPPPPPEVPGHSVVLRREAAAKPEDVWREVAAFARARGLPPPARPAVLPQVWPKDIWPELAALARAENQLAPARPPSDPQGPNVPQGREWSTEEVFSALLALGQPRPPPSGGASSPPWGSRTRAK